MCVFNFCFVWQLAIRFGTLLKHNPTMASTFYRGLPDHILCEALGEDGEGSREVAEGRSFDVGALDNPSCWELKAFMDACPPMPKKGTNPT